MNRNGSVSILNKIAILHGGDSLRSKSFRGTVWMSGGNGLEQGLRLIRNMILTRLLAPDVFGIMAIVLAINLAFQSFTEIGIKQSIIQNPKGHERDYLNGAWWFSFIRGAGLYYLAYSGAPWIAEFYNNPELTPLLRIAFLSIIFNGLLSPMAYVALKRMDFKRWVGVYHSGGVLGVLSTICLAFVIPNVWALVTGFIVEAVSRFILSYLICPFRPGLNFARNHLKALFNYARGMLGLPILTFIFLRTDIFVIGKLCSASEVGFYSMALSLAQIPIQFSTVITEVMMPAFSEMQKNFQRINQSIYKITSAIAFLGFPGLVFVILYGKNLLSLVYGTQYATVAIPFAIIFTTALFRVCSMPIASVYLAIGRPELHRLFVGIRTIMIIIFIYPFVNKFGLTGAAAAGLFSMFIGYFFQVSKIGKITNLNLRRYGLIFLQAAGVSLLGIIAWMILNPFLLSLPLFGLFTGMVTSLVITYIAFRLFYGTGKISTIFTTE